ncbi:MAG: response regulator transcription factor [Ignavibacteriae bacterium]|nr:response regulator transcription factor [Ignavibacteriota bacterium]
MSRLRVLLVEDDPNLGFILKEHLELQGYDVDLAVNGAEGMDRFRRGGFALCLADVMMPKKDGFSFAKEVRAQDEAIPLIFLTARSLKEDRVEGLRIGADDYITKPFSMEELMLRIRAVLKRAHPPVDAVPAHGQYTIGTFSFDAGTRTLVREGTSEELTTREAELLTMFCQREQGLLERSAALREIWGDDTFFAGRSMDVFISRLRKRFSADPAVQIVNVHGKGFRLVVSPVAAIGRTGLPAPRRTSPSPRRRSRSAGGPTTKRKRG